MRIVIDLQGAQSESRFRGIGRYSLALALGVARNAGPHEIWLVLNGNLGASIADLRRAFDGLVPQQRIRVFDVPGPLAELDDANGERCRAAELLREYFIEQLQPDAVLVTSLFEGFVDDAVVSAGAFAGAARTAVVLYDLIPFLNPAAYLGSEAQRAYYGRKIDSLRRAGLLLSISDYSRQEAIDALELDPAGVISISTAVDDCFHPAPPNDDALAALRERFGITRDVLMYAPGGFDKRKNIDGLITAFSLLPAPLRARHHLLIASKIGDNDSAHLLAHAARCGVGSDELILTGYVSDADLIELYRSAALFIFPSRHEGFGLPALEAMACGAPVIGADNTSIPEVIGYDEAMFNADVPQSIADKIAAVLEDPALRQRLLDHGRVQAKRFSWDVSAQKAVRALEGRFGKPTADDSGDSGKDAVSGGGIHAAAGSPAPRSRRRLAFVSPLPPERTGIADYAAQVLPAMLDYFDIDLIVQQDKVSLPPALAAVPQRSVAWFAEHAGDYDQILYQFGNSPFHSHMFGLLQRHPGVVVLHDFFLGNVLAYEQMTGGIPNAWAEALFQSHGYAALKASLETGNLEHAKDSYPCNLAVLNGASRVVVHSHHALSLARSWYGPQAGHNWNVVPLPRALPQGESGSAAGHGSGIAAAAHESGGRATAHDERSRAAAHEEHSRAAAHKEQSRAAARRALGIGAETFLVCTFGFISSTKHSLDLVHAWTASTLHADTDCELVLVGANHGGEYGGEMTAALQSANKAGGKGSKRIRIAGWTDDAVYHQYLQAADVGVQLRSISRGETSAAVLDCMNYGLATIVNANGSMAELPVETVWQLPERFALAQLSTALETLHADAARRAGLGQRAAQLLHTRHSPEHCARLYADALDQAWRERDGQRGALMAALAGHPAVRASSAVQQQLAQCLAAAPDPLAPRQLLVDVTAIARHDLKTGIERVVRTQLIELLARQQPGFRVEPVYLSEQEGHWRYRYARRYAASLLGLPSLPAGAQDDAVADTAPGDVFYSADYSPGAVMAAAQGGLYAQWRARGVQVNFLIHDLLPVLRPEFFPPNADAGHGAWLRCIAANADRLICISDAVRQEMAAWLDGEYGLKDEAEGTPSSGQVPAQGHAQGHGQPRPAAVPALKLAVLHHGADIGGVAGSSGAPAAADGAGKAGLAGAGAGNAPDAASPSFLMVGTIEPRKGHLQALAAFGQLWDAGVDARLVIVGGEGWKPLSAPERRTIPEIVDKLQNHPQLGQRLFWLQGLSDAELQRLYADSTCLLVPSEGEGFGLPLIEAASYGLPVLARDIPVFREVAGEHAAYFGGLDAEALASAVRTWLERHAHGANPPSSGMPWITWRDNVANLLHVLAGTPAEQRWPTR